MAPIHVAVGLKETPRTIKGFPTTKRELRAKPSRSKGKLSTKKKFVRELVREVRMFCILTFLKCKRIVLVMTYFDVMIAYVLIRPLLTRLPHDVIRVVD